MELLCTRLPAISAPAPASRSPCACAVSCLAVTRIRRRWSCWSRRLSPRHWHFCTKNGWPSHGLLGLSRALQVRRPIFLADLGGQSKRLKRAPMRPGCAPCRRPLLLELGSHCGGVARATANFATSSRPSNLLQRFAPLSRALRLHQSVLKYKLHLFLLQVHVASSVSPLVRRRSTHRADAASLRRPPPSCARASRKLRARPSAWKRLLQPTTVRQ